MQARGLRESLQEVLDLQRGWSAAPTLDMVRRGRIVSHEIPAWVRERLPQLAVTVPGATEDLQVAGSDGAGAKARVPWTRIFSASRAPGASEGWYVVYLFDAVGSAVFVSLNQGTTRWSAGNFERRPAEETAARSQWARGVLSSVLADWPDLSQAIDLRAGRDGLIDGYQRGNVAAFRYAAGALPDDATLESDLLFLVRCLGSVYLAEARGATAPGDPTPEVADAIAEAEAIARPLRPQRRHLLTHADRMAIERRAVDLAIGHLEAAGYVVKDVGKKESHDIDAYKGGRRLFVEVKGTTATGEEVVLTKNEVDAYTREHPETMLIVVTGIELDRSETPPIASGGNLRVIQPWAIAEDHLTPISYRYAVPPSEDA